MNQLATRPIALLALSALLVSATNCCRAEESAVIAPAVRGEQNVLTHRVESTRQSGPTEILVLLPKSLESGRRYRVLYVLPVEPKRESRFGDPVAEILKQDIPDRHGVICVVPTFADLPWYADHAGDARIRQESYLLKDVIPFVDRTYSTLAERKGRFLVGFSKSGFGACALLLRHPGQFERAAAWDAPLMLDRIGQYGTAPIFGTNENFVQYELPRLAERRAALMQEHASPRIGLIGFQNFGDEHRRFHERLARLRIAHEYREQKLDKHTWHSGWFADACAWVLSPSES